MADATAPETLGFREFATRYGWKPSYVTELRKAGRLVLTEDGRRVRVAESLRLLEDTRDPSKAGVAARHAAARTAAAPSPSASPDAGQGADGDDDEGGDAPATPATAYNDPLAIRRARAQAEREEAALRKALREEQQELGELLQRDDVLAVIADATTTLRTSLENLPTTLSASLAAETAEERCRVILANGIEHALEELSRKFRAVGSFV
jgi:Spy/CpxP family protein refolding chaperone